jgi:hypothetical protein
VSKGASLAPVWTASDTLKLSLEISRANHDYIDASPSTLIFVSRHDRVATEQARLVYTPAKFVEVSLTYLYVERDSNQAQFEYNDTLATASVTFKIMP